MLKSIGDELGPAAERVLRRRIDQARFFVGGIQDPLDAKKKAGSRSIQQLDVALNILADPELAADAGPSRPVFNRMNLSLARDGGSQDVPQPLARHPRSGLQPGRT